MDMKQIIQDVRLAATLPKLTIHLMKAESQALDPFFAEVADDFYSSATRRHPKFPLIRQLQYGVAVHVLPDTFDDYFKAIESSARRNVKKARKNGCECRRFRFNDYLDSVGEIHRSTPVRQGAMPESMLKENPKPISNPEQGSAVHDYPYFGIFKDDKLVAYAGCQVTGEMMLLATVFGHDGFKTDGVVPQLITEVARACYEQYPQVQYFVYDKFFGAAPGLRRFKVKFGFMPYKVTWVL